MEQPNPSADLLEEMLKQGDVEFFPKLRKRLDRFVDIFNHDKTQDNVREHCNGVEKCLDHLDRSSSVLQIMHGLRDFVDHVQSLGINSFTDSIYESGFESLLTGDALDFLDDANLTTSQRADRFLQSRSEQAAGREQSPEVNALASEIVADIRQLFEPLRAHLVTVQAANNFTFGFVSWAGPLVNKKFRRGKRSWFDKTARFLTDFVLRRNVFDGQLSAFLEDEKLEDDLGHFRSCIREWTSGVRGMLPSHTKLLIEKSVVMVELERIRTFLYAVVLNKPEMLREHNACVSEVIRNAATHPNLANASLLPCVSYGQLPLPTGATRRIVQFTFVLDSTCTHRDAERLLQEIGRIFENVQSKRVEVDREIRLIKMEVEIPQNVPRQVASIISKLANLQVRGVLIGNLGLAGFRHAMNPAYNRIYSKDGQDTAEGFIPTMFRRVWRGKEPYYCPDGWRRYAIDVGMTAQEFEREYGQWPVAYHGTAGMLAMAILLHGLRASGQGCFLQNNQGAVYLSPSIEYCGHPRYSKVVEVKSKHVQMVLQVRVDPQLIDKRPGTLRGAMPDDRERADPNFSNNELEWLIRWKPNSHIKALNGILVYGIMFRVTDQHPKKLLQNKWWKL